MFAITSVLAAHEVTRWKPLTGYNYAGFQKKGKDVSKVLEFDEEEYIPVRSKPIDIRWLFPLTDEEWLKENENWLSGEEDN